MLHVAFVIRIYNRFIGPVVNPPLLRAVGFYMPPTAAWWKFLPGPRTKHLKEWGVGVECWPGLYPWQKKDTNSGGGTRLETWGAASPRFRRSPTGAG